MEETFTCPVCGETNPADVEFCQNCQWRLRPEAVQAPPDAPETPAESADPELSVPDWLRRVREQAPQLDQGAAEAWPRQESGADLLAGLAAQKPLDEDDLPDWAASISGISRAKGPSVSGNLAEEASEAADTDPEELTTENLASLGQPGSSFTGRSAPDSGVTRDSGAADHAAEPLPQGMTQDGTNDEIYDWLRKLDASNATAASDPPVDEDPGPGVPDWVRGFGSQRGENRTPESANPGEILPDWLQTSDDMLEPPASPIPAPIQEEWEAGVAETTHSPGADEAGESSTQTAAVSNDNGSPTEGSPFAAPFTPDAMAGVDVDEVFASMHMPDWLSDARRAERPEEDLRPPAAEDNDDLAPADLPNWVLAMRPMESALAGGESAAPDLPLEERGPLLGLHGVLPAFSGVALPYSKPRAHSIKIEATDQQLAHAALLEDILAAESRPAPMNSAPLPGSQRGLRWLISSLLLLTLGVGLFSGSLVLPLPGSIPNETVGAIRAVESIPADAPVLIVFDYEPATTGEMEATAASLIDHLLLLKHPRVATISTSPTGSVLAERFIKAALVDRAYQRGSQYVDFGYLAGGLAGLTAFIEDPPRAAPLGADSTRVWDSGVLRGVTQLSDFAAVIVLTDGLESGRAWIEQIAVRRASSPLILLSSAQAAPVLLPYVDSGQASGLVSGIYGAAGTEQANGGSPGYVRRYWDAYSFGTYLAAAMILVGGSLSFWMGVAERRTRAA